MERRWNTVIGWVCIFIFGMVCMKILIVQLRSDAQKQREAIYQLIQETKRKSELDSDLLDRLKTVQVNQREIADKQADNAEKTAQIERVLKRNIRLSEKKKDAPESNRQVE